MSEEEAVALIVNGFCREVMQQLPMEFAVEAQKLVGISLKEVSASTENNSRRLKSGASARRLTDKKS